MRDEPQAADLVESLAESVLGRVLGPRLCRDGKDGSGITVDFTYDDAAPPLALEVTGIHVSKERQLGGEIDKKLEPQLTELSRREGLGGWVIGLHANANVRVLLDELPALLRAGRDFTPNEYSSAELLEMEREEQAAFVRKHRRWAELGVFDVKRVSQDEGVRVLAFSVEAEISGFTDRLDETIASNLAKLRKLEGYDRHLAVVVHDIHASSLPAQTPAPRLPMGIERLWVFHSWLRPDGEMDVWTLSDSDDAWTVLQIPSRT